MRTNATPQQLGEALAMINKEKYRGNVTFERIGTSGRQTVFTLRVIESSGPGHRLGQSTKKNGEHRRMPKACWHVHGDFFEALFLIFPDAWVKATGRKITRHGGNWEDRNIGSYMEPMMYSDACDCGGEQ